MNTFLPRIAAILLASAGFAAAQSPFTNFIRQVHLLSGVQWDVSIATTGSQSTPFPIIWGGSRFELWTVKSSPLTSYLLDTKYVSTYAPVGTIVIQSEDPYAEIPRTRADRPFTVSITTSGLLTEPSAPAAAKSVSFLRHVQSYGAGGTGVGLDRSLATLHTQSSINTNGTQTLTYALNSVPGGDRAKVRGEERFSIFTLPDWQAPASQLASKYIQIWPVADASVTGITEGQIIEGRMPNISIALNDLYPNSRTYAQTYQGNPVLGKVGKIVPGSALVLNETIPQNRALTINNWDQLFNTDGRWTLEVLTWTPFGIDRLIYMSFDLDRTINLNGTVTSVD